ncbi:hypothetical protein ACQCVH_23105 [Bacillus infantis]|uniref:hypothetical protein n=1 Tax=Bacillus infantis TaxID=324767 RepID=UPI003CE702B4
MFEKEFKKFKRDNFESYYFTRLMRSPNLEFFFILGINDANNFDEYWDGRSVEVLGYLVIYTDVQRKELVNYIYLIEDEIKNIKISLNTQKCLLMVFVHMQNLLI